MSSFFVFKNSEYDFIWLIAWLMFMDLDWSISASGFSVLIISSMKTSVYMKSNEEIFCWYFAAFLEEIWSSQLLISFRAWKIAGSAFLNTLIASSLSICRVFEQCFNLMLFLKFLARTSFRFANLFNQKIFIMFFMLFLILTCFLCYFLTTWVLNPTKKPQENICYFNYHAIKLLKKWSNFIYWFYCYIDIRNSGYFTYA